MALGFQDCCNTSSYFLLTGIPATVQEGEIWKIVVFQGETFCAKYVKLPPLNYSIPVYSVDEMFEKTSCSVCQSENPCPPTQSIFLSQFGSGTIAESTDCFIKTLFPLVISCVSTPPTNSNQQNGNLKLNVSGGVPPYTFYNVTDGGSYLTNPPIATSSGSPPFTILSNVPEGIYKITVTDFEGNFYETVECILDAPPPGPSASCTKTNVTYKFDNVPNGPFYSNDGTNIISITAGEVPPYSILNSSNSLIATINNTGTYTISNLGIGTNSYVVRATAVPPHDAQQSIISCPEISFGSTITFPSNLCLSFNLCGQNTAKDKFYLTFEQIPNTSWQNRPRYRLTISSLGILGISSLQQNNIYFQWNNNTQGWEFVNSTNQGITPNFNANNSSLDTPDGCNTSGAFKIVRTGGSSQLPHENTWSSDTGAMTNANASSITLSTGLCALTLEISTPLSDLEICTTSGSQVKIVFNAYGGQPTYTYYYKKSTDSQWSSTTSSILFLTNNQIVSLGGVGDYVAYVVDSTNVSTQSSQVTFTITQNCPVTTVSTLYNTICTTNSQAPEFTRAVTVTPPTGFNTIYYRKGTTGNYISTQISSPNTSLNMNITGGVLNPNSQPALLGYFGPGTYYFYSANSTDQTPEVSITFTEIPCEIIPPILQSATVTNGTGRCSIFEPYNISVICSNCNSNDSPLMQPYKIKVNGVQNGSTYQSISTQSISYTPGDLSVTITIENSYGQTSNSITIDLSTFFAGVTISCVDEILPRSYAGTYSFSNSTAVPALDLQYFSPVQPCGNQNADAYISELFLYRKFIKLEFNLTGDATLLGQITPRIGVRVRMKQLNIFSPKNPRNLYAFDSYVNNDYTNTDYTSITLNDSLLVGEVVTDTNNKIKEPEYFWMGEIYDSDNTVTFNNPDSTQANSYLTFGMFNSNASAPTMTIEPNDILSTWSNASTMNLEGKKKFLNYTINLSNTNDGATQQLSSNFLSSNRTNCFPSGVSGTQQQANNLCQQYQEWISAGIYCDSENTNYEVEQVGQNVYTCRPNDTDYSDRRNTSCKIVKQFTFAPNTPQIFDKLFRVNMTYKGHFPTYTTPAPAPNPNGRTATPGGGVTTYDADVLVNVDSCQGAKVLEYEITAFIENEPCPNNPSVNLDIRFGVEGNWDLGTPYDLNNPEEGQPTMTSPGKKYTFIKHTIIRPNDIQMNWLVGGIITDN